MRLQWDKIGERLYETGLDHGILFPMDINGTYKAGVAWNGLTAVNETPSGGESNPVYADNQKYINLISAEDFGATVEALTYPPEFEVCDGSAQPVTGVSIGQQTRRGFGLCYRTLVGNDVVGQDYGYKLHFIYGAQASPSEKNRQTINENPEAASFSWNLTTTPVAVTGYKPTAHLTVDSTKLTTEAMKAKLKALEDIVNGTDAVGTVGDDDYVAPTESRLPLPSEIFELLRAA